MSLLERQGINTLSALGVLRTGARSATSQGPRPNVAVGALIVSPSAVRDKMNQVNTQISSLDSEIRINVTRPAFLATWAQFKDNWQKFYDDHQSYAKIFLTGTGTLDRKANEYQSELTGWYEALKRENPNARLVFPPPLPPTAPPTGASVPWWGITLLTLLGTGAIAYGTYASYLYIKEAQAKRKFLEDEVVPRVLAARGISLPRQTSQQSDDEDEETAPRVLPKRGGPDSYTRVHAGRALANDPGSYRFPGGLYAMNESVNAGSGIPTPIKIKIPKQDYRRSNRGYSRSDRGHERPDRDNRESDHDFEE